MKQRLYIYLLTPEEISSRPELAPYKETLAGAFDAKEGIYVIEFDNPQERDRIRKEFLSLDILCSHGLLAPKLRKLWAGFLKGEHSFVSFDLWALLLGPIWYLYHRLFVKFWVWICIESLARTLNEIYFPHFIGKGPWDWIFLGGSGLLWLYPCLFGLYDRFLYQIHGERLWRVLPYYRFKYAFAVLVILGGVAWVATLKMSASTPDYKVTYTEKGKELFIGGVSARFEQPLGLSWLGQPSPSERVKTWLAEANKVGVERGDYFNFMDKKYVFETPESLYCLHPPRGSSRVKVPFHGFPIPYEFEISNMSDTVCFYFRRWRNRDGSEQTATAAVLEPGGYYPPTEASLYPLKTVFPQNFVDESISVGAFAGRHVRIHIMQLKVDDKTEWFYGDSYSIRLNDQAWVGFRVHLTKDTEETVRKFMNVTMSNFRVRR